MSIPFNYQQDFSQIDFRQHPERYQVGRGEQGVLLVEPYKREILPHWRFKNPQVAAQSAETICQLFEQYRRADDFVGMDMARKFIQMGYTRARRYANHQGGRKYDEDRAVKPRDNDPVKAAAAAIFQTVLGSPARRCRLPAAKKSPPAALWLAARTALAVIALTLTATQRGRLCGILGTG